MAPIIEVSNETLRTLNSGIYTRRSDLEQPQIADLKRSSWIVIPKEFTREKYSLEVSPGRLAHNSAVEKVGKELGLKFANTSKDYFGREFIGGDSSRGLAGNWYEFLKLNSALGVGTLTLEQFNDFGRLLYQGMRGKIKVYDVSGKQLPKGYLGQIFDDTFKVISPWRAEYFDNYFEKRTNGLYTLTGNNTDGKVLVEPQSSEILDDKTLMENRTPGISLEDWLKNPTSQGLPTKKIKSRDLNYLHPLEGCVARFVVDIGRACLKKIKSRDLKYLHPLEGCVARFNVGGGGAYLNCSRNPSGLYADRGVRSCKVREN